MTSEAKVHAEQPHRDFESLTEKQKRGVEAIVSTDVDATYQEIAEKAGINDSYVKYIRDNFGHIIQQRRKTMMQPVTDGEGSYTIQLGITESFQVIKILPDELSRKIYDQIRNQ